MIDPHFHVIVDYDGTHDVTDHATFTAGVNAARKEILIERLLDTDAPRSQRRKFTRREFIPGVYGEWVGSSTNEHAAPDIRIEVSACVTAMHEQAPLLDHVH